MVGFLLGLLAGAASPAQASVNARAEEDIGSVYITAATNFVTAWTLIAMLILISERSLHIPVSEIASQPFWIWLGGPCGMAIMILNIVCLPKLGSARNVMLICFGQIMTGLIIDNFALFGAMQVPMTVRRGVGALLVIAGVALVNGITFSGHRRDDGTSSGSDPDASGGPVVLYIILATLCGFACSAQIAINGTLKLYAGTALKATLISMTAGFLTTILIIIVLTLINGRGGIYESGEPVPLKYKPWMMCGGMMAAIVVGGNALAAPLLGAGVVTILNLVGMMGTGLLIDAVGFLGIEKKPVTFIKIIGMLLMIAGAALTSF